MSIQMSKKTRNWIVKQGGVVTVSPLIVTKPFKNRQLLLDFECTPAEPENKDDYYLLEEDGIKMYISRRIKPKKKEMKFWVRGFTALEQLEVKGIKRFSTVQ